MKDPDTYPADIKKLTSRSIYRKATLSELAERIVKHSDKMALAELHSRTPFCYGEKEGLAMVDLLAAMRQVALDLDKPYAEEAYDLALNRFLSLPWAEKNGKREVDCRHYFRTFLSYVRERISKDACPLECEHIEVQALQSLVKRHFYFALNECSRKVNKSRYRWTLPEGTLTIYMPDHLVGHARAAWLHTNISDPDPNRGGERQRVQNIIDQAFFNGEQEVIGEDELNGDATAWMGSPFCVPGEDLMEFELGDLARIVAREKRGQIHLQRESIRALGPRRLEKLICSIFESVANDSYHLGALAREFGISEPTFTRFAGAFWKRPSAEMPDLWRNTAQVLGSNPVFREILEHFGIGGSEFHGL